MKKEFLVPEYFLEFSCTGSDCEDTCCKDWGIHIDKSTFKTYKAIASKKSDFSKKLKNSIQKLDSSENYQNKYGKFILNKDRKCPLLLENQLCEIHKNLGPQFLCNTCRHYPRMYSTINEYAEASLTLSCPEVARKALLNEDGISFCYKDISFFEKLPKSSYTINFNGSILEKYFFDIRIFTIKLLQNRNYSIEERLGILGVVFDFLESNKDKDINIAQCLNKYQEHIDSGIYKNLFNSLDFNLVKDIQLKNLLISQKLISKKIINSDKPYLKEYKNYLEGAKFYPAEKYNIDDIFDTYKRNLTNYYIPFLDHYSYILENYLVDLVFKFRFPLNDSTSPLSSYLNLISHFSIIRTEIIGLLGYYKGDFDINSVVYLIQGMTTIINHDKAFNSKLIQSFYDNNIDNIPSLMLLFCY